MLASRIDAVQAALSEAGLDGWLFACFQGNDPISLELLGLGGRLVSRRCYYLVPAHGTPRKLVHAIEPAMLAHLPGETAVYNTWQLYGTELPKLVGGMKRLAAQYSPGNELPGVSRLDAGTAELLRAAGAELVSSADLVQRFAAVLTPEQAASHRRANTALHEIVRAVFASAGDALRAGRPVDEYGLQQEILRHFETAGLWAETPPIVGVNGHAADPHYQPEADQTSPVRPGDFLLIDLWAKEKTEGSIYGDITWCGVAAASPDPRHAEVFGIVAAARDAAAELVRSRWPHTPICGFEVDDAARNVIVGAGYGDFYPHRTGHSIHVMDHGPGANMDNLETHDTRRLIDHTCFSIEPGIYLPNDFGVRSEINILLTPTEAEITGGEPQRELLRLLG